MQIDGLDPQGIPRVFGYADNRTEAMQQCQTAAMAYIARRPDCAPYDNWQFVPRAEAAE